MFLMASFSQFKIVVPLVAMGIFGAWALADFKAPGPAARASGVGSLDGLDATMKRSFLAGEDFEAKSEPGGMDWLAHHEETGQTFSQYLASKPNRPGEGGRNTLYVLPLGEFPPETAPDLAVLQKYMELYYAPMMVKVLPARPNDKVPYVSRENNLTGQVQWHAVELLRWLRSQVPRDGYGLLAVTMTDLYPGEGWNFVFGQASYKNRVGVFSFARYHPKLSFEYVGEQDPEQLTLKRACKVLSHEMGHMFGIKHCIHYQCIMNGANSLREADSAPMNLCPICLRKLQHAIGFDPVSRYQDLSGFYKQNKFKEENEWVGRRLKWIKAD